MKLLRIFKAYRELEENQEERKKLEYLRTQLSQEHSCNLLAIQDKVKEDFLKHRLEMEELKSELKYRKNDNKKYRKIIKEQERLLNRREEQIEEMKDTVNDN